MRIHLGGRANVLTNEEVAAVMELALQPRQRMIGRLFPCCCIVLLLSRDTGYARGWIDAGFIFAHLIHGQPFPLERL